MTNIIKRYLILLTYLIIAILITLFLLQTAYALDGNGTSYTPYLVKTVEDLFWIAEQVNVHDNIFSNVYFELNNDIDFEGVTNWIPIGQITYNNGYNRNYFAGIFDGKGNSIRNLSIEVLSDNYIGLFGWISGGTVINLNMINCNIKGNYYTGGIAGYINAYSTTKNCYVDGYISGGEYVGGIAGYSGNGNIIDSCQNAATISGGHTGGIVGGNSQTIINCRNTGRIIGGSYAAGGITGTNNDPPYFITGAIERCYNTGNVSGSGTVGGLVGNNYGGGAVNNCYNAGNISGLYDVGSIGGIAGSNAGTTEHCYNTGMVVSANLQAAGGVVGYNNENVGTIKNCATFGIKVSGHSSFIGRISGSDNGKYSNNYAIDSLMDLNNETAFWINKGKNTYNGADVSMQQAQDTDFWLTASQWDGDIWDPDVWDIMDGRLPTLKITDSFQMLSDISWYNKHVKELSVTGPSQLAGLALLVNEGIDDFYGKTITLAADTTLITYGKSWNSGKGWIPIGHTYPNIFKGIFDGNFQSIFDLFINNPYVDPFNYGYDSGTGFFGCVIGAEIKNLSIVNADITGGSSIGAVVGNAESSCIIANCNVIGSVNGGSTIGGVAGRVFSSSIDSCSAIGTVAGNSDSLGGIVGFIKDESSLSNSYFKGDVFGIDSNNVGGVAGNVSGASCSVTKCYATGSVSALGSYVGGVVGRIECDNGIVADCVALNSSISGNPAKRAVGSVYFNRSKLSNNYALSGMAGSTDNKLYPIDVGHDKTDGKDVGIMTALAAGFWISDMGWSDDTWVITDGRLPILRAEGPRQANSVISVTPDTKGGTVKVLLTNPLPSNVVLIVTVHSDGKLIRIITKTITNSWEIIIENIMIPSAEGTMAKAMIWNGKGNIEPRYGQEKKSTRPNT